MVLRGHSNSSGEKSAECPVVVVVLPEVVTVVVPWEDVLPGVGVLCVQAPRIKESARIKNRKILLLEKNFFITLPSP